MKTNYCTLYALLCAMFTFVSCVDEDRDLSDPSKQHTTKLNIPDGFAWESSQAVKLSVTSPAATAASFYSDKLCSSESLIGTLPVSAGETTFTFDLPFSQEAVYVQYTQADGTIKTIESRINKSATRAVETDKIIFSEPLLNGSAYLLNIPYTGKYGTIMFEDTWPNTEDYDFNDVVVNYKIRCEANSQVSNLIDIHISLKIRALGGLLPYDFAMQIGTWTSGSIPFRMPASDMVGITNIKSTDSNVSVEAMKTEHPAIIVTGLNSLRKDNYYNTVVKEDEGVQVDFTVTIKGTADEQRQRMWGLADPKAFDYFLRHENGREIHMMGYAPTSLYIKQYDADVAGRGGKYYYQSNTGLVWGLKAPAEIGWPAEKKDITTVYDYFAKWVESGGSLIGSDGYNPLIWYDFHTKENYIAN